MDRKKITTLALVGLLAFGGTITAFATTVNATSPNRTKIINEEQATEAEAQDESVILPSGGIAKAIAEQKAQSSIPGSTVVASELEDENGVIVYGVEIKTGNSVHDIKVDANTGLIVKTDQDGDEDELGSYEKESKSGDNDNVEHENDSEDSSKYED